jgi:1,4-alpha-glucan branching enzyme
VIGVFNFYNPQSHHLFSRGDGSGIWEGFISGLTSGGNYKYLITSSINDVELKKADPFAVYSDQSEKTFSKLWSLDFAWTDAGWMANRKARSAQNAPVSIYEVHLGSWRKNASCEFLDYKDIGKQLSAYCNEMGFTHVEIMPIMEYPYDLSWGYQTTGYFATTSRFGSPQDFMTMIDTLHQANIAVILDWVPGHFPLDPHGLAMFDGTPLFEYADKRKWLYRDGRSAVFDYSKNEVCNFLISSAMFWLDKYHIDGIRVDDISAMIYLDYAKGPGQWIANKYGGRENIEAIEFLRKLNCAVYENFDGVQTYAKESTSWPFVSKPAYVGGLGFGYKWNMGWMNDILSYLKLKPESKKDHHYELANTFTYSSNEHFVLPLSHDEVSQGKGSLIQKMSGVDLERFDCLRLLIGYMFAYPGKKLLFMGCEFGQEREWDFNRELSWNSLNDPQRSGVQKWIKDLNRVYRQNPAFHEEDIDPQACEIVIANDSTNSVFAFMRKSLKNKEYILCVFNFLPVAVHGYKIGVDYKGRWEEILNSDAREYFGNGIGNFGLKIAKEMRSFGKPYTIEISIAPLGAVFFRHKKTQEDFEDEKNSFARPNPESKDAVDRIYDIDGLKKFL